MVEIKHLSELIDNIPSHIQRMDDIQQRILAIDRKLEHLEKKFMDSSNATSLDAKRHASD
jgi:hypothetical protein